MELKTGDREFGSGRNAFANAAQQASAFLGRVSHNQSGVTAILFAFMLPVLLIVTGIAIDSTSIHAQKSDLQEIADIGALAGAKELSFSNAKEDNVAAVVATKIERFVQEQNQTFANNSLEIKTKVSQNPPRVMVELSSTATRFFKKLFRDDTNLISAKSTAEVIGRPNICVLALSRIGLGGAVWLTQEARVTGVDCSVFSNSTLPGGIVVQNQAVLKAAVICSAGGFEGGAGNYDPAPYADCPKFEDPLASREEPIVGPCVAENTKIVDQTVTLTPGTYCGGIHISGSSRVRLEPGVYVVKGGPLTVTDEAELEGVGVGFYMAGFLSGVNFDEETTISLAASETGEMAGMLFFGARNQSVLTLNRIRSNNARQLLGTIYFPSSNLEVDADAAVGDQSAWTAIVVNRLIVNEGPHLVLNSNYDDTDVPVPEGIRGAGQPVTLVE